MDADLIVRGRFLTMDAEHPTAKAMAIRGGRILAVGTEAQADRWRGPRTKAWALDRGQVAVPGFIDSHAHLALDAWRRTWVDLDGAASLEECLDRLKARVATAHQGAWIIARGWDESTWPVKRYLTRQDLDRVSVSHPIIADRVDGHMCTVNTVALRKVPFDKADPDVEREPEGSPTGVLKEGAARRGWDAVPTPTDTEWAALLETAIAFAHSLGITSVHDIVDAHHIHAYQRLRREGRLAIRAYLMPYDALLEGFVASGLHTGFGDEWLRLGAIKAFADGSLGARTAAVFDPYDDAAKVTGQLIHTPRALTALLQRAHAAGFQLAVHAIGDRAVDVVVEAYARVLEREPRADHRHRIEHFELATDEGLDRVKDLGLVPSMQPNFVARWSHPGGLYERRLGPERVRRNNPYRQILHRGARLAFGSDGMPYGPLYGIGGAVGAPFPEQRLGWAEALRCYTANGAFASFEESEKGSLAPGRLADFVVLCADPRASGDGPKIASTVVGGQVVYPREPPIVAPAKPKRRSRR